MREYIGVSVCECVRSHGASIIMHVCVYVCAIAYGRMCINVCMCVLLLCYADCVFSLSIGVCWCWCARVFVCIWMYNSFDISSIRCLLVCSLFVRLYWPSLFGNKSIVYTHSRAHIRQINRHQLVCRSVSLFLGSTTMVLTVSVYVLSLCLHV